MYLFCVTVATLCEANHFMPCNVWLCAYCVICGDGLLVNVKVILIRHFEDVNMFYNFKAI